MAHTVRLTRKEVMKLDLSIPGQGGYQSLLERFQRQLNRDTLELYLSDDDLEKIPRYAYDYGQGGWQNRLEDIFSRELGPGLGR